MTVDEHLKTTLGEMHFQLILMAGKLEEANKKIAELEADKVATTPDIPKKN